MKPVLIVDGKELNVTNIYYSNGQVTTVQAEVEPNVYETYCHKDYLFLDNADKVIDFDQALKFKGVYDVLQEYLDSTIEMEEKELDIIAHEAMTSKSTLPFDGYFQEKKSEYDNQSHRIVGMKMLQSDVDDYAENYYKEK